MFYKRWLIEKHSDKSKENGTSPWETDTRERCLCGGTFELASTDILEQYGKTVIENYRCDLCGYFFSRTISREMT